ncbi:MAG: transposase, partial [Acidobacteria bacterium]|nr:transposase [Acidobacteriota bacterium]
MAEVGLLPFARTALQVATAVLPPYRSRYSKQQFTQPQLLAMLCLMRYEDWTFRETEVRLREHSALRRVLKLRSVPDYTTLYRFLKRLDDKTINQALGEAARRLGTGGPWNDCARLRPLVEAARHVAPIGVVLADAEFDSERNHTFIRQQIGARSIIPAQRGQKSWRIHGVRAEMRHAFPRRQYARRALVETVFSTI